MKTKRTMVTIIVLAAMSLAAAGFASAADYRITKKAGPYAVDVRFDRNPPITGKNNVAIEIKDPAGKAVTDAAVEIDYSMPAMPGMPAMNYKTTASLKGEKYVASLDLSMSGSWNVLLKITKGGQTQTARFTVDAK